MSDEKLKIGMNYQYMYNEDLQSDAVILSKSFADKMTSVGIKPIEEKIIDAKIQPIRVPMTLPLGMGDFDGDVMWIESKNRRAYNLLSRTIDPVDIPITHIEDIANSNRGVFYERGIPYNTINPVEKKEKKEMTIVERIYSEENKIICKVCDTLTEEVKLQDPLYKSLSSLGKDMNDICAKNGYSYIFDMNEDFDRYSNNETDGKLMAVNKIRMCLLDDLTKKMGEINTMLESTNDADERQNILIAYELIKDHKMVHPSYDDIYASAKKLLDEENCNE